MPSPIVVRFGAVLSFIVIGILLIRSFYDRISLSYTAPSQLVHAGSTIPWHPDRWSTASSRNETLEKACLVMLVRNDELHPARFSIRQIEDRFNARFGYDWVFLNDQPFTDEFINYTSALTSGQAFYGQIPKQHWSYPAFIDQGKATKAMADMDAEGIIYGGSLSYRHMCRFNSGFFYRHELMQKYDYYFRIEPYVEFYCDMYEDPFKFMRENGKKYGWVMSMYEFESTVTTLWQTTKAFAKKFPQHIAPKNSLSFMVHDATTLEDSQYNLCHFWSNFEIADLNFFRSEAYTDYFEWLDKAGGFFYERWGDAPVHSIAAGLMLNNSELHHFSKVGYRHNPYTRCPPNPEDHLSGRCSCNKDDNFDVNDYSCYSQWIRSVADAKNKG